MSDTESINHEKVESARDRLNEVLAVPDEHAVRDHKETIGVAIIELREATPTDKQLYQDK